MTDLRTAAQQALEALDAYSWEQVDAARTALRAALAEPTTEYSSAVEPVQEPVAWMHNLIDDNIITHRPADIDRHPDRWTPLYTSPPQRKPLTEEEIDSIWDSEKAFPDIYAIARAIERAHGIGDSDE